MRDINSEFEKTLSSSCVSELFNFLLVETLLQLAFYSRTSFDEIYDIASSRIRTRFLLLDFQTERVTDQNQCPHNNHRCAETDNLPQTGSALDEKVNGDEISVRMVQEGERERQRERLSKSTDEAGCEHDGEED